MTFVETYGAVRGCAYDGCPYYAGAAKRDNDGAVMAVSCRAPRLNEVLKHPTPREIKVCPYASNGRKILAAIDARLDKLTDAMNSGNQAELIKSGYQKEIKALEEHKRVIESL